MYRYTITIFKTCWREHLLGLQQAGAPLSTDGFSCEYGCPPPRIEDLDDFLGLHPLPQPIPSGAHDSGARGGVKEAAEERKYLPYEETVGKPEYYKDQSGIPSVVAEAKTAEQYIRKQEVCGSIVLLRLGFVWAFICDMLMCGRRVMFSS
jgi:hypothetical protein